MLTEIVEMLLLRCVKAYSGRTPDMTMTNQRVTGEPATAVGADRLPMLTEIVEIIVAYF